ncbi:putative bifunctional diguanylate cyclase/phosphodiesterase [Shinella sedimenti]|uniref:EAL domain-containing protein n=1 Tax=Shinella sedimenti TaxID=2919913 RepID=A0ABT0CT53_9HYPH|nr:EAL domain-containing protein [Shinella sedimenti]MCJ8151773.1 EAL domain-containing protein [Shinella sedimenti]
MRHRVSINDLGIILAAVAVLAYLCISLDIFVTQGQVSSAEQAVELDEMLLLGVALAIGLLIFAVRRYFEQKREMHRRQAAERHVRELAFQDPLTGLANRRHFEDALKIAAASPPAAGSSHAVLMLDLNGFKKINDSYGHSSGDQALIVVAQRLLGAVRAQDLVARLGGDEFVVLASHVLGAEGAGAIASRIIHGLKAPIVIDGIEHTIGTGIGVALLPADAETTGEALRKADVALYRAKAEHRSAIRFFEAEMDQRVRERARLERALVLAVEEDLIVPRFRPTLDLRTGNVVAFEVSPSWLEDDGEEIDPARFMAIAEETGHIHVIGMRLLAKACEAATRWPSHIRVAIDLMPGQIKDPKLGEAILALLSSSEFSPERLELEVAENIIVNDLDGAKAALAPLRAAGVKVTLDNFGTGYSNLYHMQEFHFDKVKIDRRFTDRLGEVEADRVIKALAGLGHGLGLVVSADGQPGLGHQAALLESGVEQSQSNQDSISADDAASLVQG